MNLENMKNFRYTYVDSSYAKMVFDYGLLFSILVIIAYTLILSDKFEKEEYWDVFILLFVLGWAFIEPCIINLGSNIFIILLAPLLELGKIDRLSYNNLMKKENE